MIDIHAHILPGMDDGARDVNEALDMARIAVLEGMTGLIATPHVAAGLYSREKWQILDAVAALNNLLIKEKIPLQLYPGAEYLLEPDIPQRLRSGEILTLNNGGKYLLVEFPFASVPVYAENVIFEIMLQGVTPIIAHPERNAELQKNPGRLAGLIHQGALAQVTLGSIAGLFGDKAKYAGINLVNQGLAHFLASDAHSPNNRPPLLKTLLKKMHQQLNTGMIELLTEQNPEHLIRGKPVKRVEPAEKTPKQKQAGRGLISRLVKKLRQTP
ncbi:tyrosine-protein phosphatase [Desulfotruncus alcoholivorax]|uniref:tyrosine-protein phosphatase n=1 Tax=Desulfotruncus alcoholivorax TaxID=265477 RepID=UPI000401545D|nr:CpsB/CapC family capsule biosynthesis tyrosine phosphatase [Desulfotruncus alcoholivorax]